MKSSLKIYYFLKIYTRALKQEEGSHMLKEIESEKTEQLQPKTNLAFSLYKSILNKVKGTLYKNCDCFVKN